MIPHFLKRAVSFVVTLFIVLLATFVIMNLAPGDNPFADERPPSPEVIEARNKKYHLDRPLLLNTRTLSADTFTDTQFGIYLNGLLHGDLGPSFQYMDRDVNDVLGPAIPVSLLLGAIGLTVALALGIPAGVIAAVRYNSWTDRAAITAAMGGVILPNFILGPLLVMVFAFGLGILPPAGWGRPVDMILPAFLTGLPAAAMIARLTRAGLIEELRKDYIRAARARGVPEYKVVLKHAMKNGILPVVSYLGPAAANVLTGTVVVETIFAIPGMGTHFVDGAIQRDYKVVLGAVLVYCVLLMTFNFLVDLAYRFLDPRVERT